MGLGEPLIKHCEPQIRLKGSKLGLGEPQEEGYENINETIPRSHFTKKDFNPQILGIDLSPPELFLLFDRIATSSEP